MPTSLEDAGVPGEFGSIALMGEIFVINSCIQQVQNLIFFPEYALLKPRRHINKVNVLNVVKYFHKSIFGVPWCLRPSNEPTIRIHFDVVGKRRAQ